MRLLTVLAMVVALGTAAPVAAQNAAAPVPPPHETLHTLTCTRRGTGGGGRETGGGRLGAGARAGAGAVGVDGG